MSLINQEVKQMEPGSIDPEQGSRAEDNTPSASSPAESFGLKLKATQIVNSAAYALSAWTDRCTALIVCSISSIVFSNPNEKRIISREAVESSQRNGRIASKTSSGTGVVALWSK
jgi:hypothetical protein